LGDIILWAMPIPFLSPPQTTNMVHDTIQSKYILLISRVNNREGSIIYSYLYVPKMNYTVTIIYFTNVVNQGLWPE